MKHSKSNNKMKTQTPNDLLYAAMRYCVVADWFESHPCKWRKQMSVDQAMEIFNKAEAQFRKAGDRALHQPGHPGIREAILQDFGIPIQKH